MTVADILTHVWLVLYPLRTAGAPNSPSFALGAPVKVALMEFLIATYSAIIFTDTDTFSFIIISFFFLFIL